MLNFLVQFVRGSIFYSSLPKQHISIVKSKLRIIKESKITIDEGNFSILFFK